MLASQLAAARAARHLARSQSRAAALLLAASSPSLPSSSSSTLRPVLSPPANPSHQAPDALASTDLSCLLRRPYSSSPSPSTAERQPQPRQAPDGAVVGRSGRRYPRWVVWAVQKASGLMGYGSDTSTAIRVTGQYYDRVALRADEESHFLYNDCGLPQSFQTWFQITVLHLYLLSLRFRALPPPLGRLYVQEVINHAFIDFEQRLRGPRYRVTKNALVRKYMNDLLHQQRGLFAALDAAVVADDAAELRGEAGEEKAEKVETRVDAELAAALWRNIFGAGWGKGMGGVKGVFAASPETVAAVSHSAQSRPLAEGVSGTAPSTPTESEGPELAEEKVVLNEEEGWKDDAEFAERLERLVRWVRKETVRLAEVGDKEVRTGEAGEAMRWGNF